MTEAHDIASWLEEPPQARPGSLRREDLALEWSEDRVTIRQRSDLQQVQVSDMLAMQVSRAQGESPRSWWERILGLRPAARTVLNVALRTRGGDNLRFNAAVQEDALEKLPWMQQARGIQVPQDTLLDLIATLRDAGVPVASWSPEATLRARATAPETLELTRPYPKAIVTLLGVWLLIPGFLLAVTDWLRPSSWILAFATLFAMALVYAGVRGRKIRIERRGSERIVEVQSLLLPGRWISLDGLERLLLRLRDAGGRWELIADGAERKTILLASGTRRDEDVVDAAQRTTREKTGVHLDDPAGLAASVSGILGLPVESVDEWPRRKRSAGVYLLVCIVVTIFAGWVAERMPGDREVTRLGGWMTGDSSILAAITGSLTMDYSMIGSPNEVEVAALSPDGRWAVTGTSDGLVLWDAESGELVERLTDRLLGYGNWVGFSHDSEALFAVLYKGGEFEVKRWQIDGWPEDIDDPIAVGLPSEVYGQISPESQQFCAVGAKALKYTYIMRGTLRISVMNVSHFSRRQTTRVSLPSHLRSPDSMVFSPDCETVWFADFSVHEACWVDTSRAQMQLECLDLPVVDDDYRESVLAGDNSGRRMAYFVNGSVVVVERGHPTEPVQVFHEWDGNPWLYWPQVAFSPDGRLLVAINDLDGFNASPANIYVFGKDYALQDVLSGHFADLSAPLRFNGDGSLLITGSRDQTARIWELP